MLLSSEPLEYHPITIVLETPEERDRLLRVLNRGKPSSTQMLDLQRYLLDHGARS